MCKFLPSALLILGLSSAAWAQVPTPPPELSVKEVRRDSLGDPLPEAALLRLGTQRFRQPSVVRDLALSPDEKTVVTIGSDHLIAWDTASGKQLWHASLSIRLNAASYGTRAVVFASDSSQFFTLGQYNQVVVWNTATGDSKVLSFRGTLPRALFNRMSFANAIDVTADGRKLAVGSAAGVVVCDSQGEVLFEIANQPEAALELDSSDRLTFGGHYSYGQFSPDQRILAFVASDSPQELQLRDAETGAELRRIKLTSRLVRFAFSPDSRRIVATERDVAVRQYAVDSGEQFWSYVIEPDTTAESYTCAVAYSPDGKIVAACAPVGSNNEIRLLDAETGREVGKLVGHTWKPWALAFAADSNLLYSSGWDGPVRRWDVAQRKQLPLPLGVRASPVVTASPDGRLLAYADDAGVIRMVDARQGNELRRLELPGTGYSQLAFSPDSQWLAGGGAASEDVHVAIWNVANGEVAHRWSWPKGRDPHSDVESLSFRPDGKQLAAAVFRQSAAYLWDLTTGQQVVQFKHGEVYGLSFSPDGKTLATAGWDKIVRFWDTGSGEMQREINVAAGLGNEGDHRMYTVCYAPARGLLATAHLDGKVRIWSAQEMTLWKEFQVKGRFIFGSICFSPDGSLLATGSMSGAVELWDPLTAESVWNTGKHDSYVYTLAFGADHRTLVSGGYDGVCYLWDLRPSELPTEWNPGELWKDLGRSGASAYRASWVLKERPDEAVALVSDKLRPVTKVMDLETIAAGLTADEVANRRRLASVLVDKDESVELLVVVQRSLALLRELNTDAATNLLREFAERGNDDELGRLAAAALARPADRR